jgi:phosphinothricin acetyltransferase
MISAVSDSGRATEIRLREATVDDAAALLEIYRPFVTDTAVSFEAEVPSVEEFGERIKTSLARWAFLVAERASRPVGYAYGTSHRARHAYRFSTETSVYLDPAHRGLGLGKRLYERLFEDLVARGYCNAYAGIALPNEGSVALHRSVGFQAIGVFPRVGFKFGAWHDVSWWHRPLRDRPPGE